MRSVFLFLAAFLASGVEAVEALTIVLAVGITRGWRSPLVGIGAAGLLLAGLVAGIGPALKEVPIDALRLVVGFLLLTFGLQWLRKAILRASGYKALHDEEEAFKQERDEAARAGHEVKAGLDWYAFTISFKGVLLEGLEVVFIVITFGSTQGRVGLAAAAAGAAVLTVIVVGMLVRAPLARVPENTLKFAVGLMLTTFGTFWATEGTGSHWPGSDLAILVILGVLTVASLGFVQFLRRRQRVAMGTA